jgi:hypothetical protein
VKTVLVEFLDAEKKRLKLYRKVAYIIYACKMNHSMCRKVRYRSKLEAMLALSRCVSSISKKRLETRYYWCRECNAYHLTKKPKDNYYR